MTDQGRRGQVAKEILDNHPRAMGLAKKLAEVEEGSKDLSIYRVPSELRKVKDDAYNPRVVSIGPLHRNNNPNLSAMKEHKWRYMLLIFQQTDDIVNTITCLKQCTDAFFEEGYPLNKKVRESYSVDFREIEDPDLAEMMLVDGCFILQLFLRNLQSCDQANDPIFSSARMLPTLLHDLTLLENQIPFFILEKLYGIIRPHIVKYTPPDSVATLALKFFRTLYLQETAQDTDTAGEAPQRSDHIIELGGSAKPSNQQTIKEGPAKPINHQTMKEGTDTEDYRHLHLLHLVKDIINPKTAKPSNQRTIREGTDTEDCKHLLHLLHNVFRPSSGDIIEGWGPAKPNNQRTINEVGPRKKKKNKFKCCASKLRDTGVQFDKGSADGQLLSINFDSCRGVIKIPPLFIDDTTDSLFRNLIAFEQCHLKSSHHITSYVIVMKSLIRSKEDIKLLKKKGIIHENFAGGKYYVDFESILDHINLKEFWFEELCDAVNDYCKTSKFHHWNKFKAFWKVRLKRYMKSFYITYFSSPWSFIAFLAAAVVFGLTVTQTHYAIHPR